MEIDKRSKMDSVKMCCSMTSKFAQKRIKSCTSVTTLKKRFPILKWLPGYTLSDFTSDMVAGLTIGLTVIPQSMAYANVANLDPEMGLYASFMGTFVYFLLGSTVAINIGPTAITSLLTSIHGKHGGAASAVLLCFYAGCLELACGILNLGFLIDFISAPVISGFSSAAAIIISITQLKGLLRVEIPEETFLGAIEAVKKHYKSINYNDLGLGLVCIVLLTILRVIGSLKWIVEDVECPRWKKVLKKSIWLISAGRNAIIVILASVMTYVLFNRNSNVFTLTGEIKGGLPPIRVPEFRIKDTTTNITHNELDSFTEFGFGLIIVPVLSVLEHVAIAKVFARGKSLDATQELIALGFSNILGSFVSSYPVTGSFSRTALNASVGVKTPLGGVLTGILVILAIAYLEPSFYFIPKASLSAVIITAVIVTIEYRILPYLWKTKKIDLLVMLITFLCCIFIQIEYGIIIGIGASLLVLLYNTARPRITSELITINGKEHVLIRPDRMLNFPSVEYLRTRILKAVKRNKKIPIIIDGIYLCGMDYTVIQCVKELIDDFKNRNQTLIFINLKNKIVKKIEVLEPKGFIYYDSMTELEDHVTAIQVISSESIRDKRILIDPIHLANGKDDQIVRIPDLSDERQSKL